MLDNYKRNGTTTPCAALTVIEALPTGYDTRASSP